MSSQIDASIQPWLWASCVGTYWPSLGISQLKHFGRSWQLFEKQCNSTHTHIQKHSLAIYLSLISTKCLSNTPDHAEILYTHMLSHMRDYKCSARVPFSAHKQTSGTVGTLSQDRYHCQLQMREHMSALTGDTKQTWLFSIKPVNLIIRLADFWKKSF